MNKTIKTISLVLIIIQIITIFSSFNKVKANIKEGDVISLKGDHECDSLVEYWMTDYQKWSYKIVWYVYYIDKETQKKYPAFCVEPAKQGVGTGYTEYNATISKETDNAIWRILSKGYMGSSYQSWGLECDDDLYSATKIALHSYKDGVLPSSKYILGTRSVDGNTVEEIQRRAAKALDVADKLYNYGLKGSEVYESPQISIEKIENESENNIQIINDIEYLIQEYKITTNRSLLSYNVSIENFPEETKILDQNNNEISNSNKLNIKIAIPTKNIKDEIKGSIKIKDAQIKTCPIFYAKSSIAGAQSYVTYTNSYETANTEVNLYVDPNNCNLEILKIDSKTRNPLSNVTFEIYKENGEILGEYVTDENGKIELKNLAPGNVKIKETKVNDKYILNSDEREILLEWGKTSKIEIENEKIIGQIKILKTSEDKNYLTGKEKGSPIENVEFEITDENGNFVKKIITNEEGIAISKDLEKGKYFVKETKTDENYILNETIYEVEINQDNNFIELNITNKSKQKLPRTGF